MPVTVLSRCQRFDLRRIEPEVMIAHLDRVARAEGGQVAADALALITRAAEGSVRDAMSLLDQAISHGAGETTADQVRAMLGLADRARVLDLFDHIMRGDAASALSELAAQYADGADPMAVLRDLAEITHWLSVTQITPDAGDDPTISPEERDRGAAMAAALPMRVLTRTWQMLLKALEEVASAPNAMMAAEMAIIRLTHMADLPSPEEILRKWHDQTPPTGGAGAPAPRGAPMGGSAPRAVSRGAAHGPQAALAGVAPALSDYPDFDSVVALIRARRDMTLLVEVETNLRLVRYSPGRIEFQPTESAPVDLAQRLGARLQGWTGARWAVSVTNTGGGATIAERQAEQHSVNAAEALQNSIVLAVLEAFPKAKIAEIRSLTSPEDEAASAALPEVEDEFDPDWDPFEEDDG